MDHATRVSRLKDADLYVVITESFCAGRSSLETLDACLAAGVKLVQLREKDLCDRDLYHLARAWRARTEDAGALFILDDRLDMAQAVDADGAHLGQGDLPLDVARRIGPGLILGASSHSLSEAAAAQDAGADYVNIGPIFATQTKAVATGAVGPELISEIRPHLRVPFTCMGGIKPDNVNLVLERGASIVAVVTAVTAAPDIRAAAAALRARIRGNR